MARSNEADIPASTGYYALPAIDDPDDNAIADGVDSLLDTAREHLPIPMHQWQHFQDDLRENADLAWHIECKKHFLAILLREARDAHLPEAFFPLLMQMAVYEHDPSLNRYFIEPCLRAFGYHRVLEVLLAYLVTGTNREKAGAARAIYWTRFPLFDELWLQKQNLSVDEARMERAKAYAALQRLNDHELADLRAAIASAMLIEFIQNEHLDVRRSLITLVLLDVERYPDAERPLIATALAIARNHPDDYIRHRAELHDKREKQGDEPRA